MRPDNYESRLIYSTDMGAVCPGCNKPEKNCVCRQIKKAAVPETDGVVRIRYVTKGRKGKGVTLITGLLLSENDLEELSRQLKRHLSTGGTVKDHAIELQGDHREKVEQILYRERLKFSRDVKK
ncbi:MAG: hypothetical protein PHE58_00835 [Candidatus Omnitrophica bacterium]|nr:hypothetical protein [Candidatus Omnitrophota bacterium]